MGMSAQDTVVEQFTNSLLAALRAFDASIPPFGLYASNETDLPAVEKAYPYREWDHAVKPFLVSGRAAIRTADYRPPVVRFRLPDVGSAQLEIFRLSKIKVRRYGSRYYVDKHVEFAERWSELALADKIRRLWKRPDYNFLKLRVIVLIAFDKPDPPLRRELAALEEETNWAGHGVTHISAHWPDVYDRGFGVGLTAWARYSEDGIDSR